MVSRRLWLLAFGAFDRSPLIFGIVNGRSLYAECYELLQQGKNQKGHSKSKTKDQRLVLTVGY